MSDPAVEAAQRAWDDNKWGPGPIELAEGHLAVAAAREALKPLRAKHSEWVASLKVSDAVASVVALAVLDDLAPLIYPAAVLGSAPQGER